MSSTISKISPIETEIEITIPAEAVDRAVAGAISRIAKEAQIRGFRKGKAPASVVRRLFGKAVLGDVRAELVSRHYIDALNEHDVDPVSEPSLVTSDDVVEGAPFTCKLRVETSPRLESLNVDGIEITAQKIAVGAEEVDAQLSRIRSSMAKSQALSEPRPAREGDAVRAELRRWKDGAWMEQPMPPQELVLEEESMRPELYSKMVGAGVGDEREIVFDNDENPEEPLKFLAKILEIQERVLPALDDELAKDVGDFDTLDALKADIASKLEDSRRRADEKRQRMELFDKLREKNPLELPPRLVEQQARAMTEQLVSMMGRGSAEAGLDEEAIQRLSESSQSSARDIVHQHFLTKEIARLGSLAVDDADLDAEIATMAKATGLPVPRIRASLANDSRLVELKASILERKVFDFVKPQVKITEIDAPAQSDDAGGR